MTSPALDRLWWGISDLKPLFKLIPGFQMDEVGYFRSALDPRSHFSAFDRYAKRVYLYGSQLRESKEEILPSAYYQVIQSRNGAPILPSLRYLFAGRGSFEALLLLTPSLISFTVADRSYSRNRSSQMLLAIVNSMPSKAPNLQHLHLADSEVIMHCRESILQMIHLTEFSLGGAPHSIAIRDVDLEFIIQLTSFPNLRRLRLGGKLDVQNLDPVQKPIPCFPALTQLEIRSPSSTLFSVIKLFDAGSFKMLRRLTLGLDHHDFYPVHEQYAFDHLHLHWPNFFRALRQGTSPAFRSLILDIHHSLKTISVPDVPDLLALNLVELRMNTSIFSNITRDDLSALVNAWTEIEFLELRSDESDIDFSGLVQIALNLPRLRALEIGLQSLTPSADEAVPLLSHSLKKLSLTVSGSLLIRGLPRILDRMFPHLSSFQVKPLRGRYEFVELEAINSVAATLQTLQMVRADELERLRRKW